MHTSAVRNAPTYSLVGDVYALLITGEQSGGAFSLTHGLIPPGGGPPLHTHTREMETFVVLEGSVSFWHGDDAPIELGPGSTIHLEPHTPHRFQNTGEQQARMLIRTAPAGFERMIIEAGTPLEPGSTSPVASTEVDIARLVAACERAGITLHHG